MDRRTLGFLLMLVVVAAPTPAEAWWDYIEQFSGPGPSWGLDIETRLICFPTGDDEAATKPPEKGVEAQTAVGFILPICLNRRGAQSSQRRVASIDLGVLFAWAKKDQRFAGGERVRFLRIAPALSLNLISNPRFDFVEYGIGGGWYRFSSEGFSSFSGGYVEPLRLDFHLPTEWRQREGPMLEKIARRLLIRYSGLVFPGGFEPNAFAPTPDARKQTTTEWVNSYALLLDLEGLIARKRK